MCQIHIINKESFQQNTASIQDHLSRGAMSNSHGSAALFIDANGDHALVRAMNFELILDMMVLNEDWRTVVLHQRYTTQGEISLANTHMWQEGSFFYCHNGVLKDEDKFKFDVDSQLIGSYLESGNVMDALYFSQGEQYSNTFIINLDMKRLWVTRSEDNTLFTDGNGQFSTREIKGLIDTPVPTNSINTFDLDIKDSVENDWMQYSYTDLRKRATHGDPQTQFDFDSAIYNAEAAEDSAEVQRLTYLAEKEQGNG